jgi:uncharacterized SAM-binding protein YcdF (DUF218 family)
MFFILSKILHYLLTPLLWIVIVIIVSFLIKNKVQQKKLRIISLIMLLFFTNPFIEDEFMRIWEIDAIKIENINKTYDYGIVLTGMISWDAKYERINFRRSTDRLMQTLDLYKMGIIDKIFIVGGSGLLFDQKNKESVILQDYLIRIGIPEDDILIESESRNTYENAREAAVILKPKESNESYLLITSAFHMRRSAACFKKQGFEFDIFVADRYAGSRKFSLDHIIVPKAETLSRWNVLLREICGFIVYKIMGYC